MKTVLKNNAEVAHVWAQQTQSEGRGSNMFFDGVSIYSYGRHFEIARFIRPGIVFLTTRDYSVSTSRHKHIVRNAISHKQVFTVPSMDNHDENVKYFITEISRLDKAIRSSITHAGIYARDLGELAGHLQKYLELFKKNITKKCREDGRKALKAYNHWDYKDILEKCSERKRELEAKNEHKRRRRQELEAVRQKENIEKWRAGEYHGYLGSMPVMLRVTSDNDIQTSHGARISMSEGIELYAKLKSGAPVHGLKLGEYTVTAYDNEILTVGCHKVPRSEIEMMAKKLGLK